MEPFQSCTDVSDIRELSMPQQLFLKPEAKLNITVALPPVRLPGKTISNWEVMERLKQMIQPDDFVLIKVSKSTVDFIRFDAEIENRSHLSHAITRLEGKTIKLSGFPEPLKVKAAESKPDFPSRHDWDKYFRDAKNMNEMKPGERPDTLHIQNLPSKWFISNKDKRNGIETPNEYTLQKVFEMFGEVRCVDIPMLDPYRNHMKASISGIKTFSHLTDSSFEAYVQFKEYICFVKAMDALRGMKLVHRDGVKAYSSSIKVDFDKTKHLSDMSIRRRRMEKEKLMAKERELEEAKRREDEAVRLALEKEKQMKLEEKKQKGERRKEREERRRQKIMKKLKKKEAEQMNIKIAIEERKLLMAQRKLESIRLLDELFERVKQEKQKEVKEQESDEKVTKVKRKREESVKRKEKKSKRKKENMFDKERELRQKLVKKFRTAQEQQMEEQREKLRKAIEGKNKLKSVLKSTMYEDGAREGVGDYGRSYQDYDAYDYRGYDGYSRGGYGYDYNTSYRGGYRGVGYYPRRSFRGGYRGGGYGYYGDWSSSYLDPSYDRSKYASGDPGEDKKETKHDADEMEDISSDSDSSLTSKYSGLNSSSNDEVEKDGDRKNKDKVNVGSEWPDASGEGAKAGERGGMDPTWASYSDYYNPRFMRGRGGRRSRGGYVPRRGWGRGGYPPQPNPNVPMNSFYMQSINSQYYKYFNKLAKGDYDEHDYRESRGKSRSRSSERVVCRKVLSRSRSRSRSRSSRSRSRSRSRKRSRSSSRSRSRRRRSKSRTRSKSRSSRKKRSRTRSKSRSSSRQSRTRKSREKKSRSRSRQKTPNVGEVAGEEKEENGKDMEESTKKDEDDLKKRESDRAKSHKTKKDKLEEKVESECSLSLSGSEEWSKKSPERKVCPLGDPDWEQKEDRRHRLMSVRSDTFHPTYDRYRSSRVKYRYNESRLSSVVGSDKSSSRNSKKTKHKKDKKRKRKHRSRDSRKSESN